MHSKPIRTVIIRACAAIALAGSLVACGDSPTALLSDLQVTASISRPEFKSGDTTTVTTTITNTGKYALQITDSSCLPYFEVVRDEIVVAPGAGVCAAVAILPFTLAGGETRVFKDVWRGDNRAVQQKLVAGTYGLRARVQSTIGVTISAASTINILP